jgi:hypothetical protein
MAASCVYKTAMWCLGGRLVAIVGIVLLLLDVLVPSTLVPRSALRTASTFLSRVIMQGRPWSIDGEEGASVSVTTKLHSRHRFNTSAISATHFESLR